MFILVEGNLGTPMCKMHQPCLGLLSVKASILVGSALHPYISVESIPISDNNLAPSVPLSLPDQPHCHPSGALRWFCFAREQSSPRYFLDILQGFLWGDHPLSHSKQNPPNSPLMKSQHPLPYFLLNPHFHFLYCHLITTWHKILFDANSLSFASWIWVYRLHQLPS